MDLYEDDEIEEKDGDEDFDPSKVDDDDVLKEPDETETTDWDEER